MLLFVVERISDGGVMPAGLLVGGLPGFLLKSAA